MHQVQSRCDVLLWVAWATCLPKAEVREHIVHPSDNKHSLPYCLAHLSNPCFLNLASSKLLEMQIVKSHIIHVESESLGVTSNLHLIESSAILVHAQIPVLTCVLHANGGHLYFSLDFSVQFQH
jgi:hypothetical protein